MHHKSKPPPDAFSSVKASGLDAERTAHSYISRLVHCAYQNHRHCRTRQRRPERPTRSATTARQHHKSNEPAVWGPEQIRIGFIGAPLATAISFNLIFILSIIYLLWLLPSRQACRSFTSEAFHGLGILFYLGAAGVAQTASEWCAWEVMTIAASL